jgi:hypothetical protein
MVSREPAIVGPGACAHLLIKPHAHQRFRWDCPRARATDLVKMVVSV